MSFAADPRSAAAARAHVTAYLTERKLSELADDSALIMSELVTNAVFAVAKYVQYLQKNGHEDLEFQPDIWAYVGVTRTMVLLGVENPTHERPEIQQADEFAEGGRGLLITEALSKDFGWIELQDQDAKQHAEDAAVANILVYAALARPMLPSRRHPVSWKLAPDFVTGRLLGLRAMPAPAPTAPVAVAERVLAVCA